MCIIFVLYCNCICIVIDVLCVVCVLYCFCSFVYCVLFERGVLLCVLCIIVVPLPPGTNPFAVKINNNNNNNNNKYLEHRRHKSNE
jgi:hypothetical protein